MLIRSVRSEKSQREHELNDLHSSEGHAKLAEGEKIQADVQGSLSDLVREHGALTDAQIADWEDSLSDRYSSTVVSRKNSYNRRRYRAVDGKIEVQTGRGRMDIIITHNQQKYIIETKIWRGDSRYQAGKKQLAAYLNTEGVKEGFYIVFDHRENPEPLIETEIIEGLEIRSYVIPVLQELPAEFSETTIPYRKMS